MTRPTITSLDDVKTWIAEHDGRIDAYWDAQFRLNSKMEDKLAEVNVRLNAVEKRIAWIAGGAAAVGALAGSMLPSPW